MKGQVEFNPQNVESFKLVGYENRRLEHEDFADDRKDAREIGVGADVVILFELTLKGKPGNIKYVQETEASYKDELFEVRLRYKIPVRQKVS